MHSAIAWRQIERLRQEEGLEDLLVRFGIKLPTRQNTGENIEAVLDEIDCLLDIQFFVLPSSKEFEKPALTNMEK